MKYLFLLLAFGLIGSVSAVAEPAMPQPAPNPTDSSMTAPASVLPPPVSGAAAFSSAPATQLSSSNYKKFRDPFKEPTVAESIDNRTDLERFAVTDFKVTGIITGPLRMRAMLVAPNAKTHYVSEKMKIGLRDGVIVKITTKSVVVREKVVNPLGEVEFFDTEIGMDQPSMAGTTQ